MMADRMGVRGVLRVVLRTLSLRYVSIWRIALIGCIALVGTRSGVAWGQLTSRFEVPGPVVTGMESPALWVVPGALIVGGALVMNEVGLTGANTPRLERYNGWGQSQAHVDDYLQYSAVLLGVLLDVSGVEGRRESVAERLLVKAAGGLVLAVLVRGTKSLRLAERPDGYDRDSFMSGHTATAFFGAELLRLEYGADYPWVAAAGYGVAVATAMFRAWHGRHWTSDITAGIGVGVASAWVGHYLGELLWEVIEEAWQKRHAVRLWQY